MRAMRVAMLLTAVGMLAGCDTLKPYLPDGGGDEPPIIKPEDIVPDPTPKPAPAANDVAGLPCANLPITATVSDVAYGKSKVTWRMTGTDKWPKKTVKKEVQGMTYLYVWKSDTWNGGKFDWFRPGQTQKDYANIHGGYMNVIPEKGDRVAFGLLDINKAQRSNFQDGVWPGSKNAVSRMLSPMFDNEDSTSISDEEVE